MGSPVRSPDEQGLGQAGQAPIRDNNNNESGQHYNKSGQPHGVAPTFHIGPGKMVTPIKTP